MSKNSIKNTKLQDKTPYTPAGAGSISTLKSSGLFYLPYSSKYIQIDFLKMFKNGIKNCLTTELHTFHAHVHLSDMPLSLLSQITNIQK